MSILDKIENLPRTYFNFLLIIIVIFTLLNPLGIPLPVSEIVQSGYDTIESIPEGSYVVYVNGLTATMIPETGPGGRVLLQHLFNKNLKIIIISSNIEGPAAYETYLKPYLNMEGKEYGVDYVHIGFIAGADTGLIAFSNDLRSVVNEDHYGTPVNELPILDDFNNVHDASLLVAAGAGYMEHVVMVMQPIALTPLVIQGSAGGATGGMAFYPDTVNGLLTGIKGGAEYEFLIGIPGRAIATIDAMQAGTILIILTIVLGNIIEVSKRTGGKK